MSEFAQFFALSFSALFPLINPLGSSLVFLGMVGTSSASTYRTLARKIAISTALFLLAIDVAGAALLKAFGISLPVVQLAGGLVVAAMGWGLLNQKEAGPHDQAPVQTDSEALRKKVFYPFTFPVTAGPGTLVVMLTLSAHATKGRVVDIALAQLGVLSGTALMCCAVFIAYAYAPRITAKVSPSTAHGILRVIAFVLLCIGVQIAWNGLSSLIGTLTFSGR
ncbi:MAG TPA: MarC family protein [Acidobacteriaceae bacterium]|jgi:multiple antibiotic resistance protein|nr:MarC family protein [Acidobacteriaceae bacterium]